MANQIYANSMEVSCKAAGGKAVCAFPDVCMTPPPPPGVPIPYPNTGLASDCSDGSRTVKISRQEVMLKNKSYFKKSTGDEAGCAPKKGVVTSKIMGKVYFNAWSMDVKMEGENVVRHLDLTTHNHGSFPGNSPTWPYLDEAAFNGEGPCKDVAKGVKDNCVDKGLVEFTKKDNSVKRAASVRKMCADEKCRKSLRCVLTPKSPSNCCLSEEGATQTGHHVVPASQFHAGDTAETPLFLNAENKNKYNYNAAPCICAEGNSHSIGLHGRLHEKTNNRTVNHPSVISKVTGKTISNDARWTVGESEAVGAAATEEVTGCPAACTQQQLRDGHEKMGIKESDQIRPTTAGLVSEPPSQATTF